MTFLLNFDQRFSFYNFKKNYELLLYFVRLFCRLFFSELIVRKRITFHDDIWLQFHVMKTE